MIKIFSPLLYAAHFDNCMIPGGMFPHEGHAQPNLSEQVYAAAATVALETKLPGLPNFNAP